MRTNLRTVPLVIVAALFAVLPARAQDASEILETALEKYEERTEGIENYTLVQNVMGQRITSYFEKRQVAGHPVFVQVSAEGEATSEGMYDLYSNYARLADRAEYAGSETVDGIEAHALVIEDLEGLDLSTPTQGQGDFEPKRMTLYIDDEEHLMRKMRIEGDVSTEEGDRPMTMSARLLDYRTVEGMPHPFKMAVTVEGAMAGADMSEEELAEARARLEELEEQMESMPESQRQMMERALGGQLEQLRQMVEPGTFEMTLEVEDLEVNTGPPEAASP